MTPPGIETQKFKFNTWSLVALMVLLLPLSIKIFFPVISTVIIYPGELLIGILALVFLFTLFLKKDFNLLDPAFIKHPITILIITYLVINFLSSVFSTMHLVSAKALVVKTCYILVFYFFTFSIIKSVLNNFIELMKLYGFGLALVIVYTLLNQLNLGFTRSGAGFACHPFYNDHTIFSAAIVFALPIFAAFSFFSKTFEFTPVSRVLIIITTFLLIAGFYFSFCRAAWLSLFVAIILLVLILIGIRFKGLMVMIVALIFIAIIGQTQILTFLKKNKVDSTVTNAGLYEHFFSFTNISSDVSNKERINRWICSIKMFYNKPLLGYGPGTYQFQYLPFQNKENMSYISREKPLKPGFGSFYWHSNAVGLLQEKEYTYLQGGGGTAHSEYFLELSESGLISVLLFIGLLFTALFSSLRVISNFKDKKTKILIIAVICSLVSYFTHAFFNNFLDDCKVAFLFWSALCMITVADLNTAKNN